MDNLKGTRHVLTAEDEQYPSSLKELCSPPEQLHVIGNPAALRPGIAIVGSRLASPYGRTCARQFARIAAEHRIPVVSGGARGIDTAAHRAALEAGGPTVAVLGSGCDAIYPAENSGLFQQIVESGGSVVSEYDWQRAPRPYQFRVRNRIVAGLARAVLVVEAGLPSGTFSIADEALALNRCVLAVPGPITSQYSKGSNYLIRQGATPIIDDETFFDALRSLGMTRPDRETPSGQGIEN